MFSILSTGHFHPEIIIDNAFLESLDIGTSNDWILERVGIQTRRTVLPLDYIRTTKNRDIRAGIEASQYKTSDLGARAAQTALKNANLQPNDIGLVISGSCFYEMNIPALACLIADKVGIQAPCIDLNSACSTFDAQLHFLRNMKPESLPDAILVVQADAMTPVTNYADRSTAVLFGDGASAQIISPRIAGKATIIESMFNSRPSDAYKVKIPYAQHFVQEGQQVQRFAITQTVTSTQELLSKAQLSVDSPCFIGHQANLTMLQSTCKRIGINENKHYYNVDKFGNCGAASAPSVLSQKWETFSPGDYVAIVVVGSGLSWGSVLLKVKM